MPTFFENLTPHEKGWHTVANGEIIASGQGYKSKAGRKGIESIKTNAPGAPVVDNP